MPNIDDTVVLKDMMTLWRKMRTIHKSNKDPSNEEFIQYKVMLTEFQEKFASLMWVPLPNQVHRLCHVAFFISVAFFMESSVSSLKSIGAYSLEGRNIFAMGFPLNFNIFRFGTWQLLHERWRK